MAGADQLIPAGAGAVVVSAAGRPWAARGLRAAILVSTAAHLSLWWLAASGVGRPTPATEVVAAEVRMQIRVAAAQPAVPADPIAWAAPTLSDEVPPPLQKDSVPTPRADEVRLTTNAGAQPAAPESSEIPRYELPSEVPGADGYLLRSALSQVPVPIGEIDLRWPDGMLPAGREAAMFWMFVDETGIVRKFVPDGPTLAPRLEEIARSAFMAARFEPGQRDGQPVKSLLRIEVVFDNRRLTVPAASVVSDRIL